MTCRRHPLKGCFPLVLLALGGLTLSGCNFRAALRALFGVKPAPAPAPGPEAPGGGDGETVFRIADLLEWIAWAFTLAGGALIAAAILAVAFRVSIPFLRFSPGRLAAAGFAFIVGGQLLLWLGAALWWIALVAAALSVVAFGALVWTYRWALEYLFGDLNKDGTIGRPKAHGHPTEEAK